MAGLTAAMGAFGLLALRARSFGESKKLSLQASGEAENEKQPCSWEEGSPEKAMPVSGLPCR